MKIILSQDVVNLGEEGDIREVTGGYARNFLLPQKLAVRYTKENLRVLESRREQIEKKREEKRTEALGVKERIEQEEIRFKMRAGENGTLFGSVSSALIGEELEKLGYEIERRRIDVPDNTIRAVGNYKVRVRLYGHEEAELTVIVEAAES
jgi:large subunit ribosomal protein L9